MCIIMVMEALVSGMWTSIASRSAWTGSCETRHGQHEAGTVERQHAKWVLGLPLMVFSFYLHMTSVE